MTLVEVLVVVALSSLTMGVVVSLVIALQRTDRDVQTFAVRNERRSDLAEVLRADVRRAAEVARPSEKKLAIRLASGGEILYELADGGCRRIVAADGAPPRTDFFAVGSAHAWKLGFGSPGRRPLIMLTMHYPEKDKKARSAGAPLLVYAALGADLPETLRTSSIAEQQGTVEAESKEN
jgi:hypothetical protein